MKYSEFTPEQKKSYTKKKTTNRWREKLGLPVPENINDAIFEFMKKEKKLMAKLQDEDFYNTLMTCANIMNSFKEMQNSKALWEQEMKPFVVETTVTIPVE